MSFRDVSGTPSRQIQGPGPINSPPQAKTIDKTVQNIGAESLKKNTWDNPKKVSDLKGKPLPALPEKVKASAENASASFEKVFPSAKNEHISMDEYHFWVVADPDFEKYILSEGVKDPAETLTRLMKDPSDFKSSDLKPAHQVAKELNLNKKQTQKLEKLYQQNDFKAIVRHVTNCKIHGTQGNNHLKVMSKFYRYLSKSDKISPETAKILKEAEKENLWNRTTILALRIPSIVAGNLQIRRVREELSRLTAELIIRRAETKAERGDALGAVVSTTIPGHVMAMEIEATPDAYLVHLANTHSNYDNNDNVVVNHTYSFPKTPEGRSQLAKALRTSEALHTEWALRSNMNRVYDLVQAFEKDGSEIINLGVAMRPNQHSGNCGIRCQSDIIGYKLQRSGHPEEATAFQKGLNHTAHETLIKNGYSTLEDMEREEVPYKAIEKPLFTMSYGRDKYLFPASAKNKTAEELSYGGLAANSAVEAGMRIAEQLSRTPPTISSTNKEILLIRDGEKIPLKKGEEIEAKPNDIFQISDQISFLIN